MMNQLNPFDVSFSGIHLIEASAGTGKTYNIESLYVRAIIEERLKVDEILVVTYTEAATKELRDRLMRRLRQSIAVLEENKNVEDHFLQQLKKNTSNHADAAEKLNKAVRSFDEAAVYTIHGFCGHALRDHAFESGAPFEAELIGDDRDVIRDLVDDYWRNWIAEVSDDPLRLPLLKLLVNQGYQPDTLTDELSDYIGKPYLNLVSPPEIDNPERVLEDFKRLFEDMHAIWKTERDTIYVLLRSDQINGHKYAKNHLTTWMEQMDLFLDQALPPIEYFERFPKFSQNTINSSIKSSAAKPAPEHAFFKKAETYKSLADQLGTYTELFKKKLFNWLRVKVYDKKEELGIYSYDDMLTQLRDALTDNDRGSLLANKLRESYPLALVDEFQDTDPIQYQIFREIYADSEGCGLFMIGDPKQSIYSFRGADVYSYLLAKRDAPPSQTFSLSHNYRSVPALIEGINCIYSSHTNPFILEDITFTPVSSGISSPAHFRLDDHQETPVEFRYMPWNAGEGTFNKGDAQEMAAIDTASSIKVMLEKGLHGDASIGNKNLTSSDIAVLVRTHRQATLIRDALRTKGIKSVTHSQASVFESEEADELYTVLKAMAEPGSETLITTALATPLFSYNGRDILEIKSDERDWAAVVEQFRDWHGIWLEEGFAPAFRTMLQQAGISETVMKHAEGERKLTNLVHLSELLQQQESEVSGGIHSLLKWFLRKRKEEGADQEAEQLRLESDENLVSVITMHHSKGLEYPIVFCPFLWYTSQSRDSGAPLRYHDFESGSSEFLDFCGKSDPHRADKRFQKEKEELAEAVRLAYVAMTRAKYKCVVNCVPASDSTHAPLGYLLLGEKPALNSLEAAVYSEASVEDDLPGRLEEEMVKLAAHPSIDATVMQQEEDDSRLKMPGNKKQLESLQFNRDEPLPAGYGLASFSSLTRIEQDDSELGTPLYYDEPLSRDAEREKPKGKTIFTFPKGPDPGTAIHHIFENITFADSANWDTVISEQLQRQNINNDWRAVVGSMLETVLRKPLIAGQPEFCLSKIGPAAMVEEMEFYFTMGTVQLHELLTIIRAEPVSDTTVNGFAEEGFLKGFIDLTFSYDDRFYILDYKTNYLGDTPADYEQDRLQVEMHEALYDLQYHLYTVALHRYLKQRQSNYSYDKHMGGAYYLFLRGMNETGREGIFYDRPSAKTIIELDNYLKRQ